MDSFTPWVTALIERLVGLGADTEARAIVPGDRYRYSLGSYHLRLSLQTPLHWAASNGSVTVVKELLRHGANPVARDNAGSTPALCAVYAQACDSCSYFIAKRQQVIKLLPTHGARLEDKDASAYNNVLAAILHHRLPGYIMQVSCGLVKTKVEVEVHSKLQKQGQLNGDVVLSMLKRGSFYIAT
ncbi:hypothetical protein TESG_04925 [Trichophyton tonsurans CBS 112818]|uniref:Uncharacterized protein n=1 Tax=Trichophyton tonsurans (strain CBS 112818) TaxID=647933 RepID=F2S1R8_TRIT1|nr:hypothetical protein TESG_04925 [Trichophyton tonsurans CBS 112818]